MKKFLFVFALASLTVVAGFAQTKHHRHHVAKTAAMDTVVTAPSDVQTSFNQQFTNVADTSIKWNKSYSGNWIASFNQDSAMIAAQYDSSGHWISTHTVFTADNVPSNIVSSVKTKFPNASIKDATKVEREDVNTYYRVDIDDMGVPKAVLANDHGTVTE